MPQTIVKKRAIQHLIHFTRASNLPGILTNGIIPRQILQQNRTAFIFNDLERLDERTNRTCLSISYPNCKMLYTMMTKFPADDWAIIRLKPDTLWNNDCLFTETNAATKYIKDTADASLKGAPALEKLFADEELRKKQGRQSYETTDVQAEVLVSGTIPTNEIIDINFHLKERLKNFAYLQKLAGSFKGFKWQFNADYFYQRKDNG